MVGYQLKCPACGNDLVQNASPKKGNRFFKEFMQIGIMYGINIMLLLLVFRIFVSPHIPKSNRDSKIAPGTQTGGNPPVAPDPSPAQQPTSTPRGGPRPTSDDSVELPPEIKEWAAERNVRIDRWGVWNPGAQLAAWEGRVDILVWMLTIDRKVVNSGEGDRIPQPIHFAAKGGHIETMKWLKEQGADINARTDIYITNISNALPRIEPLESPMDIAAYSGQVEVMKWLQAQGADVNAKLAPDTDGRGLGYAPIHRAASAGQVEAMEWLLSQGANINEKSVSGDRLPIHLAAYTGQTAVMKWMKEQGADINAKDADGWTPMHNVANANNVTSVERLESMKWLYEQGADINAKATAGAIGRTPMHNVAADADLEVMKWLIDQGTDINARIDSDARFHGGWTPLDYAVVISEQRRSSSEYFLGVDKSLKIIDEREEQNRRNEYDARARRDAEAIQWMKDNGAVSGQTETPASGGDAGRDAGRREAQAIERPQTVTSPPPTSSRPPQPPAGRPGGRGGAQPSTPERPTSPPPSRR
jgi:ankyrin repeat protein